MRAALSVLGAAVVCAAACGKVDDSLGTSRLPPSLADPDGGPASGGRGGSTAGSSASGARASGGGERAGGGSAGSGTNDGGSSTGDGGPGGVSGSGGSPEVPPDLMTKPTVWIGQVESTVTYPTVDTDPNQQEKVVLILDAITSSVTGTVTFGAGPPPTPSPSAVYPSVTLSDGTWPTQASNWRYAPYPGFSYTIVSSELKGDRLALNFVPLEVFTGACTAGSPDPGGTTCPAPDGPTRELDLVVTGNTMAGELSRPPGNWLGAVPAIRLERVQ